eukprot:TRINITY_DN4299_c0_g1_i1.p1 TRINITY_DN4299_c0_g1~~TRINITY_DN4299_c0_g1_i1.p1  ORF type:complete len:687 (-),score=118.36 TRINITY_DN4299_c0_g1_i1:178-2238(-)
MQKEGKDGKKEKGQRIIGAYLLGKTIGSGSTGKVKLAFHIETGERVAIKIIDKAPLNGKVALKKKLEREIAIMKLINHPHVLRLYDVYDTEEHLYLILEHAEKGELFEYLLQKGSLDPSDTLRVFQQLIEGLDYCHSLGICHRDLKPENLLLMKKNVVKIADFGMATLIKGNKHLETSCGSPHYASPEVILGHQYDGRAADVWSCGVILFALLTGNLPFDDEDVRKLLAKVKAGHFVIPPFLHHEIRDLITRMLTTDPEQRITVKNIKLHPWYCSKKYVKPSNYPTLELKQLLWKGDRDLDDNIIKELVALWNGDQDQIVVGLMTSEPTLEKTVYLLLEERNNNKILQAAAASKKRSKRQLIATTSSTQLNTKTRSGTLEDFLKFSKTRTPSRTLSFLGKEQTNNNNNNANNSSNINSSTTPTTSPLSTSSASSSPAPVSPSTRKQRILLRKQRGKSLGTTAENDCWADESMFSPAHSHIITHVDALVPNPLPTPKIIRQNRMKLPQISKEGVIGSEKSESRWRWSLFKKKDTSSTKSTLEGQHTNSLYTAADLPELLLQLITSLQINSTTYHISIERRSLLCRHHCPNGDLTFDIEILSVELQTGEKARAVHVLLKSGDWNLFNDLCQKIFSTLTSILPGPPASFVNLNISPTKIHSNSTTTTTTTTSSGPPLYTSLSPLVEETS